MNRFNLQFDINQYKCLIRKLKKYENNGKIINFEEFKTLLITKEPFVSDLS